MRTFVYELEDGQAEVKLERTADGKGIISINYFGPVSDAAKQTFESTIRSITEIETVYRKGQILH